MGIDRKRIVETYFPPGSEVATHYTPCAIPHGCTGDPWYEYDPILGKEMLAAAGFPDGFDTKIQYREAARPYLPDPTGVATELKNQLLANLGIRAELVAVAGGHLPGRRRRRASSTASTCSARARPTPTPARSSIRASGRAPRPSSGPSSTTSARPSRRAGSTTSGAKRDAAYAKANDAIRSHVPMIPIARTATNAAFRADVDGRRHARRSASNGSRR